MQKNIHPLSIGVWCILLVEICIIILFGLFATYDDDAQAPAKEELPSLSSELNSSSIISELNAVRKTTQFMDIHVMIFIGFGFLMTFMKRYSFGGLAFNFLLAALVLQWDLIINGFFHLNNDSKIPIGLGSLIQGDVAAAAVLISMGALLGRTTFLQLLVMGLIEIILYCANWYLAEQVWQVSDVGGSIFVHTFGAYFGLAVSWALHRRKPPSDDEESFVSSYTSDVFAMIGSLFLWIFWPSFNAADAVADGQQRAIINTYLSLASCCVVSFLLSYLVSGERKFDMVHVQNSTLAGGVAVGTVADMMLEPWGALLIGAAAAVLSVMGYAYLTPGLARRGLPDTCGVHNLHGMPGVLGGMLGVLLASLASTDLYGSSLIVHYPAMGEGRKAGDQAANQLYALLATLLIAVIGGLFTGFLLSLPPLSENKEEDEESKKHLDDNFWIIHKTI